MLQKIAIACYICALLTLGFYIDKHEVDTRPTMRSLINLGAAYGADEQFDKAMKLFKFVVLDYVKVFGPPGNRNRALKDNLYYKRHIKYAIRNIYYLKLLQKLKRNQDKRGH